MDSLKKTRIWTYSVIGVFFAAALVIVTMAYAGTGAEPIQEPEQVAQAEPTKSPTAEPTMTPEDEETVSENKEDDDGLAEGQMRTASDGRI